jgi:hypothetical protein
MCHLAEWMLFGLESDCCNCGCDLDALLFWQRRLGESGQLLDCGDLGRLRRLATWRLGARLLDWLR